MQRFKAELPTGNYPGNPEDLVRDNNGDFVLHEEAQKRIEELETCLLKLADSVLQQHDNGDYYSFMDIDIQDCAEELNRIL